MLELQARSGDSGPARPPDYPETTTIVDSDDAEANVLLTGAWTSSTSNSGFHGADYLHDGNSGKGEKRAVFVASRHPIESPLLVEELLMHQGRGFT